MKISGEVMSTGVSKVKGNAFLKLLVPDPAGSFVATLMHKEAAKLKPGEKVTLDINFNLGFVR